MYRLFLHVGVAFSKNFFDLLYWVNKGGQKISFSFLLNFLKLDSIFSSLVSEDGIDR